MIMESSRKSAKYALTSNWRNMSRKHSSKYFRTYFASAMKTESEVPDGVPKNLGRTMNRRDAIAETGKIAIAATAALLIVGGVVAGYHAALPSRHQTATT